MASTLDLSGGGRGVSNVVGDLSPSSRAEYLEILGRLLQAGVVGTERLEVGGEPYTSFASTRFADPRVAHARLFDRSV